MEEVVNKSKLTSAKKILRVYYRESPKLKSEADTKKVFLKTSQDSQKNTCTGVSFLKKLQGTSGRLLLKNYMVLGTHIRMKAQFFRN